MSDSHPLADEAESLFASFVDRAGPDGTQELELLAQEHPEHAAALRELWEDYRTVEDVESAFGLEPRREGDAGPPPAHPRADLAQTSVWRSEPVAGLIALLLERRRGSLAHRTGGRFAQGGLGELREGWDEALKRGLAVKRILPRHLDLGSAEAAEATEGHVARFVAEAQITAQLQHPGVVPIYELGLDDEDQLFITSPKIEGRTLRQLVDGGRASAGSTTRLLGHLVRVAETVGYAHARGVVHRDLKPDNVMVGLHGEVYVLDWGLASVVGDPTEPQTPCTVRLEATEREPTSPAASMAGVRRGTPAYMPPEQLLDGEPATARGDLYALGVMLYELLAGCRPYEGADVPELADAVREGRRSGAGEWRRLPKDLRAIAEKAMARRSSDRYGRAEDLAEDLRAFLEGRVVSALESGVWTRAVKWVRRNRRLSAVAALFLVAAGAAAWQFEQRRTARSEVEAAERQTSASLLRAANHAALRCDFPSALASLDDWSPFDEGSRFEADLLRVDVLDALRRHDESKALLLDMLGEGDEVEAARLAVRCSLRGLDERGEPTAAAAERFARAADVLERAAGVPPFEAFVARAFSEPRTEDAIEWMRRASRQAPHFRSAYSSYLSLLALTGRFDELNEECDRFERHYPGHASTRLLLAVQPVVEDDGEELEARLAGLDGVMDTEDAHVYRSAFEAFRSMVSATSPDVLHGASPSLGAMMTALGRVGHVQAAQAQGIKDRNGLQFPMLPSIDRLMNELPEAKSLLQSLLGQGRPISEHGELALELLEVHEEAFLYYAAARVREQEGRTAEAIELYRRCTETPSLFLAPKRHARFLLMELLIGTPEGSAADPDGALLRSSFDWFRGRDDLGPAKELPSLVGLAEEAGLADLRCELAERWVGARPESWTALTALCEARIALGRLEEARITLDRLSEIPRARTRVRTLEKRWKQRLEELIERPDEAEPR